MNDISNIGELIRTQDNRCTSNPLFLVEQKRRVYGFDMGYSDEFEWVDENDYEHVADADENARLDNMEAADIEIDGWRKVYYRDQWEFVTACFTEQGCKDYLRRNGHNLKETRIYATSLYRNEEMIAIREWLKECKREEDDGN